MSRSNTKIQQNFDSKTFHFLRELAENNEREWFNANKHRYEDHVLDPALAFIEKMDPLLSKISRHFVSSSKRVGGSLMRVYRDTRFSKDKQPYKTNIGIQFRHELGRDVHAPGFYVHIEPRGCFLGAGLWRPEASALNAIRAEIVEHPTLWRRASTNQRFRDQFELAGESLKRPPRGFPEDAPHMDDLKRKDFMAIMRIRDSDARVADFAAQVAGHFGRTAPLMRFLCGAMDLEF